ncbi:MAG: hypothetical protein U1E16_09365 [Hyphomicrobiales bacterium]
MVSDRNIQLSDPDPIAQQHIENVQQEHNQQYIALRRRAQGLFEALKGRTGVRTQEDFEKVAAKASKDFDSGVFLVERLGTSRFLDPELTCILLRLRSELLAEIENPTAADRMNVDMAIIAYRNALRVQNLINSVLMETERQLFGQISLQELLGQAEAEEVSRLVHDVEQRLIPLLEKTQKMMNRALDRLRGGASSSKDGAPRVTVGFAREINVNGR